ncbi:hypothetical protein Glove_219g52 [Diversispora epigaea]|uniref:Uncharacterized protein n=1 Tax=Diversispora epigaea TaxID=1348612 RepID=A0A397IPZ7_9GLOM|nr:hypothetical protein Glove_219g52 [Diversispora epigaea]
MYFLTILFTLLFPIYYLLYIMFDYSYIITPLLALIFYKIIIKREQKVPVDNLPKNVSDDESNSDENSSDEGSSSEDENINEEVIHFRVLLVRKYARVNYVRRRE